MEEMKEWVCAEKRGRVPRCTIGEGEREGLFFVASHRSLCLTSGLEPSSNGGFFAWREDAVVWRLTM
ncbi:hypothetical protein YC2023_085875 [Brassica napus]